MADTEQAAAAAAPAAAAAETNPEETAAAAAQDEPVAEKAEEGKPQPPRQMRAIVLNSFGGFKSLKIMMKDEPASLGEDDVLVRVHACGLNFLDLMVRQGAIDNPPKTPFILGFECAGEVEAVGSNVKSLKPGCKVVALTEYKAWAELVVAPAKYVYELPVGMSFEEGAAITMNFAVAYILLFEIGGLQNGKSVLIHSAGGGVGQAVAQLCKTVKDVTLYGVCSQSKQEKLKDSFNHLLDRSQDYVQELRKLAPEGVDLVLDCLCGEDCNRGYSLLKPMGKYVLYGSANIVTGETKSFFSLAKSWWQVDKVSPIKLYEENKSIAGFNLRHLLYKQDNHKYVRSIIQKVMKLWQDRKIKPVIDSTWALEDITEAMQKMHDRKNIGKIVLDPSKEPIPKPQGKSKDKDAKSERKSMSTESADEEGKPEETSPPPDSN